MPESYKLTYFNLRAVGEPVRLIFAYVGVPYEDNRIEFDEWPKIKKNFPYGQMPILEVGDKVLAQSNAICRYLGRKYNLHGTNDWEAAKLDEIADSITDLRRDFPPVRLEQDETKKAAMLKNYVENVLPKYYDKLEATIAKSEGPYIMGSHLTWVDLMMAHYIEGFKHAIPNCPDILVDYPRLQKLTRTVFALPQIQTWLQKRPQTPM